MSIGLANINTAKDILEWLEVGDDFKKKFAMIENSKLSYDEYKEYNYYKNEFMNFKLSKSLSDESKREKINSFIEKYLLKFDSFIKQEDSVVLNTNNLEAVYLMFLAKALTINDNTKLLEEANLMYNKIKNIDNNDLSQNIVDFKNLFGDLIK